MKIYACDLETYVSENPNEQEKTWVWSSAGAEIDGTDLFLHHTLKETFEYFEEMQEQIKVFYHNLKFDGAFWLDFLLRDLKYTQAIKDNAWLPNKEMVNNSFKYLISDMGQWYSLTIKTKYGYTIELIDSLKIIPFTLKQAGEAFQTKHQKLDMEYSGFRNENHIFSKEEREYILNDVLCLKECIEFMRKQGHTKSTVGACCMEEYKNRYSFPIFKDEMKKYYPNLYDIELPYYIDTTCQSAGEYINRSYKGGWCYLKSGKENQVFEKGGTFDVNSLYPSMMHSISGNKFPVYEPTFWAGNYIPDEAKLENRYYFVRIKTRFYLKEGFLPTIQIKNNPLYKSTEYLETSDIYYKGSYHKEFILDGKKVDSRVELTLTETDYHLFLEHYNVVDFEILDGCYFYAITGLFDEYIDHFAEIKKKEKGALRTLAKLFLNNLYGQFAKSTDSSFKYAYIDEEGDICYKSIKENKKIPGFIAIGSAITSYARNFTIRTAQRNYNNFIYADTDSIHMTNPDEVQGMQIHDKDFCCWKFETAWDKGIFVRQKTYMEIEQNTYDIKCAGMTPANKKIFIDGIKTGKYQITDFKVGLEIETGKLRPKRIHGGIVLVDTSYKLR